jgi:hypothetical protein
MRLDRPLLLVGIVLLAGCGGGGEIKHATQPNGPPQPQPPPPERLDTTSKRTQATQAVVQFAKAKYKAQLIYEGASAQFLESAKIVGTHREDGSLAPATDMKAVPGTWRVRIPAAGAVRSLDATGVEGISSPEQMMASGGVLAREFVIAPDGKISENPPIMAPPPIVHGKPPGSE